MPTGIYKRTQFHKDKISQALMGENNSFFGKKHSVEARQKIRDAKIGKKQTEEHKAKNIRIGEKNGIWKGDDVGYDGIHSWVERWKGKTDICEKCGVTGLTGHQIHWANIDHKYRRVLDDYIRLCALCHRRYDIENGLLNY